MRQEEFSLFVTELCEYIEHRIPRPETLRAWYGDCSRVPGEALTHVRTQFRELDKFPPNLPKWLLLQFRLWLEANPEKRAKEPKKGCNYCHEGWIIVSKYDQGVMYRGDVLFRCGNCNAGPGPIPAKTCLQLLEGGYCKPVNAMVRAYHAPFTDRPADEPGLKVWERPAWVRPEVEEIKPITADDLPF